MLFIVIAASCGQSPTPQSDTPDTPEFGDGESTAILLDYLRTRRLCGFHWDLNIGNRSHWSYEEADFIERYVGKGVWKVSTSIPSHDHGARSVNVRVAAIPAASWKVYESSQTVLRDTAPTEC